MPSYRSTPQFEHGLQESTGILIVNLGTPEAPTTGAVRRFLRKFLWDPRVVEYPRILWWLILNLIILVIRPSRSAAAYRKVWTAEGSPLLVNSQAIAGGLRERFAADNTVDVELAMTYGEPSIRNAIDKLLGRGVRRILVIPLYPQYSGTTTAAVFDAVTHDLRQRRWVPEFRFVNSFHDDPDYIDALAASVRDSWQQHGRGDKLLMSFHGVPKSTLENGDPYFCQCQKTARLLAESLELADDDWTITFQSRVGRSEWLTPYTDETVKSLGQQGVSRLDVVCPGFSTDCLETLEEIAMQNAEFFTEEGGDSLHYIPALNSRDDHLRALAAIIDRHTRGWTVESDDHLRLASRERAIAAGASS